MIPIGTASKIPSTLSKKPPWPGNNEPVSFTLAFLFKKEIIKSPICANNEMDKIKIKIFNSKFRYFLKKKL